MRSDSLVSYADLERLGWPQWLIDDYMGRLRELTPQHGADADPNGIYVANLNGMYVDTTTPGYWFNPVPGESTGWVQIV